EQMAAVQDYAFSVDGAIARKLRHFDGTRLFHYDQQDGRDFYHQKNT
ncbi:hypothetical protein SARC_16942, partial [Sphaeroforma arctica JP610]